MNLYMEVLKMRIDLPNPKEFSGLFAKLLKIENNFLIKGISIDSRNINKGDLFIALKGDKVDGHNFIDQAILSGCSALLLSKNIKENIKIPKIILKEPKIFLGQIAKKWREKFKLDVVGITGSNGKTTTKDLLVNIFSYQKNVHSTLGNYNTDLSLPLTLLQLNNSHAISFLEMGANKVGDISYLCDLSKPNIGVITNISYAHLSTFKSINNIKKAKLELFESIDKNGIVFLNNDDKNISQNFNILKKITYGFNKNSNFNCEKVINDAGEISLIINNQIIKTKFKNPVLCNNILTAVAISLSLGVSWENIKRGVLSFKPPSGRCVTYIKEGILIIDDTYNANLSSTLAAIEYLSKLKSKGKKIMVFGDMLELGSKSKDHHTKVGKEVSNSLIQQLITFGENSLITHNNTNHIIKNHFTNYKKLLNHLKDEIKEGDAVLFKASRGMNFDLLINKVFKS